LFADAAPAATGAETGAEAASVESVGTFEVKDIAKLQAGSVVNTRRGNGLETEFTAGARRRYECGRSGRSAHDLRWSAGNEINAEIQAYVAGPPRYVKWISKIRGVL